MKKISKGLGTLCLFTVAMAVLVVIASKEKKTEFGKK